MVVPFFHNHLLNINVAEGRLAHRSLDVVGSKYVKLFKIFVVLYVGFLFHIVCL